MGKRINRNGQAKSRTANPLAGNAEAATTPGWSVSFLKDETTKAHFIEITFPTRGERERLSTDPARGPG